MKTGQKGKSPENRPLFGEQTVRTVENMSFSNVQLWQFPEYISACAAVKKAAAWANFKAGHLSEDKALSISLACDELIDFEYDGQFPIDVFHGGGGIGINFNLNEVIAKLAGPDIHPVEHVNLSQSTSDVCHTSLRVTLISLAGVLEPVLDKLADTLRAKAEEFAEVQTIARTCWQDGIAVGAGTLFGALADAVERQRKILLVSVQGLHKVNLGWTVVGTGQGASDAYRAHILGELRLATGFRLRWRENPYDAAQYPDDIAHLSADIRILAGMLSKHARDLRVLSSGPEAGLGEIILPAVQAGSTFFPGKVNPVIPEMVVQCGMLIAGNDSIIQNALDMGEAHLNLWEEMMGFLLIENIRMLTNAADCFEALCIRGARLNEEVCRRYAQSSMPLILQAKEEMGYEALSRLIAEKGLPAVVKGLREKLEQNTRDNKSNKGEDGNE